MPTVAICLKIVVPGPVQRFRRHQGKTSRGCRGEALRTPRAGQWFHLCCGGCSLFAESSPYSDFQWLPMTSHDILIFLILLICLLQCGWQCLHLRPPNFRTASCKALVFHLNLLKVGDTAGLWSWHVIAWYVPWSKHRIYMAFWHWPSIGGFLMMGTSTHMIGETTVTFGIYGNPTFDNGTYSTYSIWWFDCLMCFTHVPTKIISHTRMRFRAHSLQGWKSG